MDAENRLENEINSEAGVLPSENIVVDEAAKTEVLTEETGQVVGEPESIVEETAEDEENSSEETVQVETVYDFEPLVIQVSQINQKMDSFVSIGIVAMVGIGLVLGCLIAHIFSDYLRKC